LWGELCCCSTDYSYYSYCRNPTGREFFVPAWTLIGVKLLTAFIIVRFSTLSPPAAVPYRRPTPAAVLSTTFTTLINGWLLSSPPAQQHTNWTTKLETFSCSHVWTLFDLLRVRMHIFYLYGWTGTTKIVLYHILVLRTGQLPSESCPNPTECTA
jgi:hypothetical protein